MALSAGTKLGPYEVLGELGAGGMGEVYRARDTRLDRTVAIKILPEHLSSDPGRRARFEREARTISGLSHPNICALFDIGDQDGIYYVVLEYLEGRTLADRLVKGPLPVSEVLKVGADIASALETAHRNGIVHRDLKPANVMLTKTGAKLLDFGLAKPSAALASAAAVDEPTLSKSLTEEGVIVGTFRYMAPEQLEGKDTDGRTDIFALGALLYEMSTGASAFGGASRASIIAAIMNSQPAPISALQPQSPPALDRVVQTCLAKDPDERWQTAHDLKSELQWIAQLPPEGGGLPPQREPARLRQWSVVSVAALVAIALLWIGLRYWQAIHVAPPAVVRFSIPPPAWASFDGDMALFPDGRWLAFGASCADQQRRIWLRPLDSEVARPLPGTENADGSFFWSPDSRDISFFRDGKLKRVNLSNGMPEDLCEARHSLGATWNASGVILFGAAESVRS